MSPAWLDYYQLQLGLGYRGGDWMILADLLDLVAVYQIKNEGAEMLDSDTRSRSEKLDALAMM